MERTEQVRLSVLCAAGTKERAAQLSRWLDSPEIHSRHCKGPYELLYHAWADAPDLVIFSSDMAGVPADDIIRLLHESHASLPVVLLVPTSRLETYLYLEAEGRVVVLAEDTYGRYAARLMRLVREQLRKAAQTPRLGHAVVAGILTHAPTTLAVTDRQGRLVFINDEFLHALAGSDNECLGKPLQDLCAPSSAEIMGQVLEEIAAQGTFPEHRLYGLALRFSHAGEELIWHPAVSPLEHDDNLWLVWNFRAERPPLEAPGSAQQQLIRWAASVLRADGKDIPLMLYHGLQRLAKSFSFDVLQIVPRLPSLQSYQPFLNVPKSNDPAPLAEWDDLMAKLVETGGRVSLNTEHAGPPAPELAWMRQHGLETMGVRALGDPRHPDAVMLAGRRANHAWGEADESLLDAMQDLVAGLLVHVQGIRQTNQWKQHVRKLRQELETASGEDALSGLASRARFEECLTREVRLASRLKHALSLVVASVDGFRQYEAHHGKAMADKCLSGIGATIGAVFQRAGDKAGRVSGEKFAVILAGADARASVQEAERLRKAIRDLNISHPAANGQSHVSLSVGVATLPAVPVSEKELWRQAELALGRAVADGGDRVVHFLKMEV
jgi:diguanylate cyclase (GGDEF)-like protein